MTSEILNKKQPQPLFDPLSSCGQSNEQKVGNSINKLISNEKKEKRKKKKNLNISLNSPGLFLQNKEINKSNNKSIINIKPNTQNDSNYLNNKKNNINSLGKRKESEVNQESKLEKRKAQKIDDFSSPTEIKLKINKELNNNKLDLRSESDPIYNNSNNTEMFNAEEAKAEEKSTIKINSFINTPNAPTIENPTPEDVARACPHFNSVQGCKNPSCKRDHVILLSKKKEGFIRNLSMKLMKKESISFIDNTGSSTLIPTATNLKNSYPLFKDHPLLHQNTKKAIKTVFKYDRMTVVQSETIKSKYIDGYLENDYMVKSKTGSGKTLAFLIPIVEILLRVKADLKNSIYTEISNMKPILCVIISPTRELAIQTEKETQKLLAFHPEITSKCFIGGTNNIKSERSNLENHLVPDIFIATPGRFHDHLLNAKGFTKHLSLMQIFVLDEADQLLTEGFKDKILEILQFLPSRTKRQTLMFSATISKEIQSIAKQALKPKFDFIDCVKEAAVDTNTTLLQQYMPITMETMIPILYTLLQHHIANTPNYKVIVFFPSTSLSEYMSVLFSQLQIENFSMHSKKSQSYRSRIADKFKNDSNVIMFSSDVSARGVDYPDVTLIIQVSIPSSMEQYVHRIGRTARAGKTGVGIILLLPFEQFFWKMLKEKYGRDIYERPPLEIPQAQFKALEMKIEKAHKSAHKLLDSVPSKSFIGFLGFYNQYLKNLNWNKETLVKFANEFSSKCLALDEPKIYEKTARKMGLLGIRGLMLHSEGKNNQDQKKGNQNSNQQLKKSK